MDCFWKFFNYHNFFVTWTMSLQVEMCPCRFWSYFVVKISLVFNKSISQLSLTFTNIYWGPFLHHNKYIILLLEQSILEFMSNLNCDAWTVLVCLTYGQTPQLLHFFMPGISLLGLPLFEGGTFDLTSLSLIFLGLL